MYKIEKDNYFFFIRNNKNKFKILDFEEPYQIKIVDITYGDKSDGGYWVSILDYTNEFMAKITIAVLKNQK
jgi:hypothetical protein